MTERGRPIDQTITSSRRDRYRLHAQEQDSVNAAYRPPRGPKTTNPGSQNADARTDDLPAVRSGNLRSSTAMPAMPEYRSHRTHRLAQRKSAWLWVSSRGQQSEDRYPGKGSVQKLNKKGDGLRSLQVAEDRASVLAGVPAAILCKRTAGRACHRPSSGKVARRCRAR